MGCGLTHSETYAEMTTLPLRARKPAAYEYLVRVRVRGRGRGRVRVGGRSRGRGRGGGRGRGRGRGRAADAYAMVGFVAAIASPRRLPEARLTRVSSSPVWGVCLLVRATTPLVRLRDWTP